MIPFPVVVHHEGGERPKQWAAARTGRFLGIFADEPHARRRGVPPRGDGVSQACAPQARQIARHVGGYPGAGIVPQRVRAA